MGRGAFPTFPGCSSPQELSGEDKQQPPGFRAPLEGGRAGGLPQACPHCWPTARGLQASTPLSQGPGAHCQGSTCRLKRLLSCFGWDSLWAQPGTLVTANPSSESLLSLHTGQGSSYFLFCFHPPHRHRPRALKAKKGFSFSLEKCSWKALRRNQTAASPVI